MPLPDYFLADLPPEAAFSPAMITEACETLKRNREKYLALRKLEDIVRLLCEVAAGWLEPDNKFRRLALDAAAERRAPPRLDEAPRQRARSETGTPMPGFSAATVARGLDDFFGRFTPENFQALLLQDLGEGMVETNSQEASIHVSPVTDHPRPVTRHFWRGPQLLVHIAAGNIPNPALMSLTLGLLTRSAQFMKCASGASLLPRLFAHSIYEADHKLGACLELAEWPGGQAELEAALFGEADCRDGHRQRRNAGGHPLARCRRTCVSLATASGSASAWSPGKLCATRRLRNWLRAWRTMWLLGTKTAVFRRTSFTWRNAARWNRTNLRQLLAVELMNREAAEPRGRISVEEAAAIASRRAIYETLAAHRGDVKIWQSRNSTAWTVVFEHEARFHFSPLNRFIFVKPVPDLAAVFARRG